MLRFSANLSMLFPEHAFEQRFAAAARAGFKAVEYVSPYMLPKQQVAGLLANNGLTQALFNMPAGDWEGGDRGIACAPARRTEFSDSIGKTIDYAKTLGCCTVNCLAGLLPPGVAWQQGFETMVENVRLAAPALQREGIQLVIEPINRYDMPGFLLNTSAHGMALIEAAKTSNLKLQYDIYHMQRMEGELATTMKRLMPSIGHIQIADNPGRHEPGSGEINYPFLFGEIEALGYEGWVGCEYRPAGDTAAGLGWMKTLLP